MKRNLTLLVAAMLVALTSVTSTRAQSKKDLEKSLAETTAAKDSLQKKFTTLSATYDSINKAYLAYDAMYNIIKEKVIPYDFEPASIGSIIDSLRAKRDSTFSGIMASSEALRDTLKTLNYICDSLRTEASHLRYIVSQYIGNGTIPMEQKDLGGSWLLNLQWFKLTNDSIQSGLISIPAPPENNPVAKITFVDNEIAELTFSKGDVSKCFYKVNSFSNNKPYSIDLSKGTDVNIRLNANPGTKGELQVSYRIGNGFYYGFMRKM